jgi:hypothetical protein
MGCSKAGNEIVCWNWERIKIWKDSWLPTPSTHSLITPIRVLDENATMDSLILPDTMKWDTALLELIFLPSDVEVIKNIPLSIRWPNDIKIWTEMRKGCFTVKSAYNMMLWEKYKMEASTSSGARLDYDLWKAIWSTRVQPKVRTFIWKACRNILPTLTKLFDKGVSHAYSCQWCLDEPETCDHLLWQCGFAQRVWKECPINFSLDFHSLMSFFGVIRCGIKELDSPGLEILFTTAWELWNARNEFYWNTIMTPVSDICHRAVSMAFTFMDYCNGK